MKFSKLQKKYYQLGLIPLGLTQYWRSEMDFDQNSGS